MEVMKQTAVEWLVEQLKINNYISDNAHWLIEEAKEMEKQQIAKAYSSRCSFFSCEETKKGCLCGENYYNEKFKTK